MATSTVPQADSGQSQDQGGNLPAFLTCHHGPSLGASSSQRLAMPPANNGRDLDPDVVKFLWQAAMDNACNISVADPTAGIDRTIIALRVLKDYLPQCAQEAA